MLQSNPNRKSFSLSLSIPLSRSSITTRPSKDFGLSKRSPNAPTSFSLASTPVSASSFKGEQPLLPVSLTDSLDPSEKMKLLRKTRKLSRILGEVPIPVSMEDATDLRLAGLVEEPSSSSSSASATSSPGTFPVAIEPLTRSASVIATKSNHQREIHRARSLASLRPSLSLSATGLTRPFAYSRKVDHPPPLPPSPVSPVSPSSRSAEIVVGSRRNSVISARSRVDSTASSIFFERTPEQVQRARAAKLSRQLGDNVPPEVLLRASSPVMRSPPASPSIMSFTEASMGLQDRPSSPDRRTPSVKRGTASERSHRRRLSLDVKSFVRGDSSVDIPLLPDAVKHRVLLKKSGSLGRASRPNTAGAMDSTRRAAFPAVDSDADSDLDDDILAGALTVEKRRTLNVRRARKMAQMFGSEPPPALFQITNLPSSEAPEDVADDALSVALQIQDGRSDSRLTFVSVAASAPPSPAGHELEGRRDSHESTEENLSPLVFADPVSQPPSVAQTPMRGSPLPDDDESELLAYMNPSQPSLVAKSTHSGSSLTSPSQRSLSSPSASSVSFAQPRTHSQTSHGPFRAPTPLLRRPSPPPFADFFRRGSSSAPTSPPSTTTPLYPSSPISGPPSASAESSAYDPAFRTRRIRAAKLSRFFGVGLQDITPVLAHADSVSSLPSSLPPAPAPAPPVSVKQVYPVPPVPPLPPLHVYTYQHTESTGSVADVPVSPTSTSRRPSASSEEHRSSARVRRKSTTSRRSQSATRPARTTSQSETSRMEELAEGGEVAPLPPLKDNRNRSNSQPEGMPLQNHGRTYSTTVEVAAESKGKYFFLEGRRGKTKELEMHAAIKQLRKMK